MYHLKNILVFVLIAYFSTQSSSLESGNEDEIKRSKCGNILSGGENPKETRLQAFRDQTKSALIDAFILTSYDDHREEMKDLSESPLMFFSGLNVSAGEAAITANSAALWIDSKYFRVADKSLSCSWKIFKSSKNTTIGLWLQQKLPEKSIIGADPSTIPHEDWVKLVAELEGHILRPANFSYQPEVEAEYEIISHNSTFSGDVWQDKVKNLRKRLSKIQCNAIVISSLSEIEYLLNLRSSNFKYVPLFRAYLIVSEDDAVLYTNRSRVTLGPQLQLKFDLSSNLCSSLDCVVIKNYHEFWDDLKKLQYKWQNILLPTKNSIDMGTSEEIYSALQNVSIIPRTSPVVFMRSQKNDVEREGMRRANVRDAVAFCETFRVIEEKLGNKTFAATLTEDFLNSLLMESRKTQDRFRGLLFETSIAFGENSADRFYRSSENSSAKITKKNLLTVDFGSQYLDGSSSMARTIHFGKPSREQKIFFTNLLAGIIHLGLHVFPENMLVSGNIDILIKSTMWKRKQEYQFFEGSGIGAFLDVEESPINIAQKPEENLVFKDGNFFTVSPSHYKEENFGVKLRNVFEVVDTGKENFSGARFLKFRLATLVPFDIRLIELGLLTAEERMWLNEYNANIREIVGDELKKQNKMDSFYWMMNQTEYISQYLTEEEYLKSNESTCKRMEFIVLIISIWLCFSSIF